MVDEEKRDTEQPSNPPTSTERRETNGEEQEREQEVGVEDSFPASDPPSSNVFE